MHNSDRSSPLVTMCLDLSPSWKSDRVWSLEPDRAAPPPLKADRRNTGSTPIEKGVEFDMDVDSDLPGDATGIRSLQCSTISSAMPIKFTPSGADGSPLTPGPTPVSFRSVPAPLEKPSLL